MGRGSDAFGRALEGFEAVLRDFPNDRWSQVTPCDPWTARDVAGHTIGGVAWAAALISGSDDLASLEGPGFRDPSSLAGLDPMAAWTAARSRLQQVVADCDPDKVIAWPFGEQSVDTGLTWFSLEVLVHTWDLAQAAGKDVRLDAQLVHDHLARLRPLSPYLRGPGRYGPELEAPPGATEQDQLVSFLGRVAPRSARDG